MKKLFLLLAGACLMPGAMLGASAGLTLSTETGNHSTRALPPLSINIQPGNVTEIRQFVLDASGAGMIINPDNENPCTLNSNGEVYAEFLAEIADNTLVLTLFTPVTAAGEYEVVVPEGFLLIEATPNPATKFPGYVIEKIEVPQEIIVTPAAGSQIFELASCNITWRGYDSVFIDQVNLDYDTSKIYFTFEDTNYPSTAQIEVTSDGTIYTFAPREPITGEGRLRLTIPADQILINGEHPSREVSYYWNLTFEEADPIDIVPAPGKVAKLSDFVITLPETTESIARGSGSYNSIDLMLFDNSFMDYAILANYTARISQANKTITLTSAGDTFAQPGKYKLVIPTAYFLIDGKATTSQTFLYEVDPDLGIVNVSTEDGGHVNVYTVDGKVILDKAEIEDVKGLNPGLYIVNGKKVVIK